MAVIGEWALDVFSFTGGIHTVNLHFDRPRNVTVQVAMGFFIGPGWGEVGISGFAQNFGPMQSADSGVPGLLARWMWKEQLTDLWLTGRGDGRFQVAGSARILEWG